MVIFSLPMERTELIEILRVGLKAISPYNCQPWQFQYKNCRLLIFAKRFDRGFFGNFQELIYYSLGAFLENLTEGARHHQYDINYVVANSNESMDAPVCTVTFSKIPNAPPHDITHVMERYTNRKLYHQRPADPAVLEHMRTIFQGNGREIINVTQNPVIIDNCALLERIRISNQALNDELMFNINFNRKDAPAHPTGLDVLSLELPFMSRQFLSASRNPTFRQTVRNWSFVQHMAETAGKKILTRCSLLIAFRDPLYSKEAIIRDWMDIQKILNTLHQQGLSSQLIASGVDMLKMSRSFLCPSELSLLSHAEKNITQNLGFDPAQLLTLLRIGYGDECRVKSVRQDPATLLTAWET